jgi:hypothetical protein
MSNAAKPCAFCGNTTYYYFPNMTMPIGIAGKFLGMQASTHHSGHFATFTMIACQGCGQMQMFMTNPQQVMAEVPGSQMITATRS